MMFSFLWAQFVCTLVVNVVAAPTPLECTPTISSISLDSLLTYAFISLGKRGVDEKWGKDAQDIVGAIAGVAGEVRRKVVEGKKERLGA